MKYTRDIMAFCIVAMFAFAIYKNPTDNGYAETLKNIMMVAVGFYLGGSKIGSDTAAKNADIVGAAASTPSSPQPVIVQNTDAEPVLVEAAK